jgi:hypothetical protein
VRVDVGQLVSIVFFLSAARQGRQAMTWDDELELVDWAEVERTEREDPSFDCD